jgi:hypothetical protein
MGRLFFVIYGKGTPAVPGAVALQQQPISRDLLLYHLC